MNRPKIILLIIALLILGIGAGYYSYYKAQAGNVTINFTIPPQGSTVSFNGKTILKVSSTRNSNTYRLHKGDYALTIKTPGYKTFSTNLAVKTGDRLQVAADLEFNSDPTLTSADQISALANSGVTLTNITYFYGKTWAVFEVQLPGSDPALAAAQYNPVTSTWSLKAGPGTFFTTDSLQGLPTDVSTYILNTLD